MSRASAAAPIVVATGIAALMLWLAAGPFDPPAGGQGVSLPPLALVEPSGAVPSFPRRFTWRPLAGADTYEITVVDAREGNALFRQRGSTAQLELQFDPGAEPASGAYAWEVLAYARGRPVARGEGRFTVQADAEPGGADSASVGD